MWGSSDTLSYLKGSWASIDGKCPAFLPNCVYAKEMNFCHAHTMPQISHISFSQTQYSYSVVFVLLHSPFPCFITSYCVVTSDDAHCMQVMTGKSEDFGQQYSKRLQGQLPGPTLNGESNMQCHSQKVKLLHSQHFSSLRMMNSKQFIERAQN